MKNLRNGVMAQASENNSGLDFTYDFARENAPERKKGGPYPKHLQDRRKDEVYKLFFEYGYSERRIANVMKVNRATVKSDLNYWFNRLINKTDILNYEMNILIYLERLNAQRARLRDDLNKVKEFQEKIQIEKLIFDIDNKIAQILLKFISSEKRVLDASTKKINNWFKKNKKDMQFMTLYDQMSVSRKAYQKIEQIIKEDRKQIRNI